MKAMIVSLGFVLAAASGGSAAEQTLTGAIGDSHCGSKAHPTEARGKKISERDCIVGSEDGALPGCIKLGAKYILVSGDKIYQISNQDFAGLRVHAAHNVKLTGEVAGDTITVKNIAMVPPKLE